MHSSFYEKYGKSIIDVFFSGLALCVLSPLLILTAILIKIEDGGKIFFLQKRIGRDFKTFKLIKFRTMSEKISVNDALITRDGDKRITKAGHMLRKLKIDELPQLLNVLLRQMSIIGPRPEVEKYVNLFMDDYKTILQQRPGLSDLASIKYRNEEEILAVYEDLEQAYIKVLLPDKIKLNKSYVNNVSLKMDLKLMYLTIRSLFNVS